MPKMILCQECGEDTPDGICECQCCGTHGDRCECSFHSWSFGPDDYNTNE